MLFLSLLAVLPAVMSMAIRQKTCDSSKVTVPLIAGLSVLAGETTAFVTVGRGVQNYTCTAGKFVSAGAVAKLYDASCIISMLLPYTSPDQPSKALTEGAIRILDFPTPAELPVKFDHFFTRTATGGIAPVFREPKTGIEVVASVVTKVDAPEDPANTIPWLQLKATSGDLAKSIFRTHTVKGQPPASCTTEGEALSIDYSAMYYFAK